MDHPRDPGRHPDPPLSVDGSPRRKASRPAPSRLARWLRPPRKLRPTRAGWLFFCITLGVGFSALNTGNNLLYLVLSLLLAFLVLSGVLSESSLRGVRVRRRVPRELQAEAHCSVVLEISNHQSRLASYAIVVVDHITQPSGRWVEAGRVFALHLAPGETVRRHYRFRPEHRGDMKFEEFQVFTRFPFGLFLKSLTITAEQPALVFPHVEHVDSAGLMGSTRGAGEQVSAPGGVGADAVGLRNYSAGDPLRRIHWRASIRKRELLVREVESERDAEIEVRLRTTRVTEGEAFERAVSWAASEISAHLDTGTRVSLRTDHHTIPAADGHRQRARLLSYLALVRAEDHAAPGDREAGSRADRAANADSWAAVA